MKGLPRKPSAQKLIDSGLIDLYKFFFVITGCPRSGTLFMAMLFRSAGIPINHEGTFGIPGGGYWLNYSVGDSSALAVPFLHKLPKACKVVHAVREPVKVLTGLSKWGLLDDDKYKDYWFGAIAVNMMPSLLQFKGLDRYIHFYIGWNRTIEQHTRFRYRVEDLAKDPRQMFIDLGVELSGEEKFWNDPKTHTADHKEYLTIKDFEKCALYQDLVDYSKYLGYE